MSFLVDKVRIVTENDMRLGRKFCPLCRKMVRVGQRVRVRQMPDARYRRHNWTYTHYPSCPMKEAHNDKP